MATHRRRQWFDYRYGEIQVFKPPAVNFCVTLPLPALHWKLSMLNKQPSWCFCKPALPSTRGRLLWCWFFCFIFESSIDSGHAATETNLDVARQILASRRNLTSEDHDASEKCQDINRTNWYTFSFGCSSYFVVLRKRYNRPGWGGIRVSQFLAVFRKWPGIALRLIGQPG